ncbi:MAG TPA: hypothetical protein VHO71_05320 [Caproiciproducens sp.]|nr:hypothetical protein [Caproiciproducens sp.]
MKENNIGLPPLLLERRLFHGVLFPNKWAYLDIIFGKAYTFYSSIDGPLVTARFKTASAIYPFHRLAI